MRRLSHSADLMAAAKSAQELDARYQPQRKGPDDSLVFLGQVDASAALAAFIERSGLAASALAGEKVTGVALREGFLEASRPTESSVVTLVVLDGLDLDGTPEVPPDIGPTLRRLDASFLEEFFEGALPGEISSAHLDGLAALEFRTAGPNPPWAPSVMDLGSLSQKVRRKAWPWATYVNLFSDEGFVSPVAIYRKGDSLICSPPIRATVAAEPVWQPRHVQIGDDEWDEIEEPFITLSAEAAKLLAFLQEMEGARLKAAAKGHRADTALRLFARYAESTRHWRDFGASDDEDVVDRSIADGATLMEAITLNRRERDKGRKMASRLAHLLADNSVDQGLLADQINHAYGVRSDLVHADIRPDRRTLDSVAALFSRLVRPALVAFLRSGGDVQDIIRCPADPVHAARMRALAAVP